MTEEPCKLHSLIQKQNPKPLKKWKEFLKAKNKKRIEKKGGPSTKKNTLKLELGWRHGKPRDDYRQVKFPQGGGTRTKDFKRSATNDEVLSVCVKTCEQVSVIDGEVFTVEKYRNHASVAKGNTTSILNDVR